MNFKGTAAKLQDLDISRIAHRIGVGEDELHAVMEVEARGSGFDAQGRPAMLFEPHVFYRMLPPGGKRDAAVDQGIAYDGWRPGQYPNDSYPRLEKAILIDQDIALQSASWGLGQVMGFNHNLAGYSSALAMVQDFMRDEDRQLNGMINFIIKSGLDDDLREHDWHGFARGYSGKSYAKHGYHTKLSRAYAKWAGIRDTPYDPAIDGTWEDHQSLRVADDAPPAPPAQEIPRQTFWQALSAILIQLGVKR